MCLQLLWTLVVPQCLQPSLCTCSPQSLGGFLAAKLSVPLYAEDFHSCVSSPGLPRHHQPSLRLLKLHPDKTQLLIFPINLSKTAVKVNPSLSKLFPHRTLKFLPLLWESKTEPMEWPSALCVVGLLLPARSLLFSN